MCDENVFAAFGAMFQEPDDDFQDPRDPGSYGGSLSAVRFLQTFVETRTKTLGV